MQWKKVALIGVGLLGGSLGLALKQRRKAAVVAGFVRRRASIRECKRMRAVDYATLDLLEAVRGADLIILCTPIAQMRSLAERLIPVLEQGAIITDVGSVKGPVVRDVEALATRAGAHFVGSHPMAGAEKMGVTAARADLFQDAVCVVTPTARTPRHALRKIEALWKSLGSRVLRLSPEVHDQLVSKSSHLPHVVATVLAYNVLSPTERKEQRQLCANGFRDATRIASGSPEMWRDIALANRKNLAAAVGSFIKQLERMHESLRAGDQKAVAKFFEEAKLRRDRWRATHISRSPE